MKLTTVTKGILATVAASGSIFGIVKAVTSASSDPLRTSFGAFEDPIDQKNQIKKTSTPLGSRFYQEEEKREVSQINPVPELSRTTEVEEVVEKEWTEEDKKRILGEANKTYEVLGEYSFKLFNPDCTTGTGWILDYQLREGNKYPLVWYIATNAHVIGGYRFSENFYQQSLPWSKVDEVRQKRAKSQDMWRQLKDLPLDQSYGHKCESMDRYGYLDIGITKGRDDKMRKGDYGLFQQGKIKEPKLFFSAFNFLDNVKTGVAENHYTDFVVLEIEFTDEEYAKQITRNFAEKYTVDYTKAINIFADPLEDRYREGKLSSLRENFYLLAYPGDAWSKLDYVRNIISKESLASHLVGGVDWEKKDRTQGLIDPKRVLGERWKDLPWDGKKYSEFGHWYEMKHNALGKGSSGGLFVDKDRNAVAVKVASYKGASWSLPLRSRGFTFWDGGKEIKTPAYDLILGGENHVNSYKDQVIKYVTDLGKETWLSKRGWQHVTDKSKIS